MRLLATGMFLALLIAGCGHDPNAWRNRTDSHMAYIMMQTFVKQELKSPASAKFPNPLVGPHKHAQYIGNHTYLIDSWVDAQNVFGASIRTRYVGKIRQVSDSEWILVELTFRE